MNRLLVCGNLKLNLSLAETRNLISGLVHEYSQESRVDIAVAPVAPFLFVGQNEAKGSRIQIAAQNVFYEASGAYTGEWSPGQLKDLSCKYAIIGHSERRQYFNETDEMCARKAALSLKYNIAPIVCVGETETQRENGEVEDVISRQVSSVLKHLTLSDWSNFSFAYEPIWAIGTGKTATVEEATDVHRYIRNLCVSHLNQENGNQIRILYGGSVKPENSGELMAQDDIDGALVGGASLKLSSFSQIIQSAIGLGKG